MSRDDQVYLEHIRDAIDRIEEYTKDIDESGFKRNHLIQDGVARQLGIIGEAVKRLSKPFRDSHPGIPWRAIAGMRDKLIHDYFGISIETVWTAVQVNIPPLRAEVLRSLTDKLFPPSAT
jgi:uncharacterized protein with HEPN domain